MSSFLAYVGRIGMLLLFVVFLMGLSWPDITLYVTYIAYPINLLWFLNTFIDMTAVFAVTKVALGLIFYVFSLKIIKALIHFVASGSFRGASNDTTVV